MKNNKLCYNCREAITKNDRTIVTQHFGSFRTYHNRCYKQRSTDMVISEKSYNIYTLIGVLICLFQLWRAPYLSIKALALLAIIYLVGRRAYAYFHFKE